MERANEGGDTAFHVDRATPVEQVAAFFRGERVCLPALTRRDDVKMAGIGKMARTGCAVTDRKEIFDRSAKLCVLGRIASDEP